MSERREPAGWEAEAGAPEMKAPRAGGGPEFLSDEWLAALDARGAGAGPHEALSGITLVVQQVVELPTGAECRYHVTIADGWVRVAPGDATRPDVTLTSDYETARAIHAGEWNAQHALARARLRIGGDLNRLLGQADALAALGDLFAGVRETTTYDA